MVMSSADLLPAPSDKPPVMVGSKIKRLDYPDHRFLRYASPHPFLSDHTSILAATATRVTTLPSLTTTVGVWIDAGSHFETEEINKTAHFLERCGSLKRRLRTCATISICIQVEGADSIPCLKVMD
ncbi:Peptidase M16 N-terminal protein [Dioscorea alata]|uniref:Peptidase M16 N-terminal protein n=1 Tax=Dioscorea alata TaxID=55571 RepID=A0ACB7TWI4_DIOAL|nr:Peptidase M16 N-terminal protein [Dioscorea alata]